jgi:hypothetical protein
MDNMQTDLFGATVTTKSPIDRETLTNQLVRIMSRIELMDFVKMLTNEFDEVIHYAGLSNGESQCQKMSLLFNPHRLATRTKSSKFSIYEAIKEPSFISGLARASIWKNKKVSELLYQVIQLGINGIQYVNEFPPHIARDICLEFGISSSSKILDPCAGWGGRMIGISVVANRYDCFEPCGKTYEGLVKLSAFITGLDDKFIGYVYNLPFEESLLEPEYYDFALTSPPYYDTEIYSNEATNSLNKYKTFDDWCDGFYYPLVTKTMKALKPKGVFVLNIGSRNYPLNERLIEKFGDIYSIEKRGNYLSGNAGLGRDGEGEMFYAIRKTSQ